MNEVDTLIEMDKLIKNAQEAVAELNNSVILLSEKNRSLKKDMTPAYYRSPCCVELNNIDVWLGDYETNIQNRLRQRCEHEWVTDVKQFCTICGINKN